MNCRLLLLMVITGILAAAEPPAPGTVLWRLDPAVARSAVQLPAGAVWSDDGPDDSSCLRVALPAGTPGSLSVRFPIDLRPWRGSRIRLLCQARAEAVSKPAEPYNGVKCMLHWRSPGGGEQWHNENGVFGSFAWRQLSCTVAVDEAAGDGDITLGLQDSHGTVSFADVRIVAERVKPVRPEPVADAPPPFRGHDLPRLRGVMSANRFREEDFAELARWKVNLVRWQLTRNWGAANTDRDLPEYDRWLDGRLDELALALASAQRHGIRLVVDLHSPPGGRLPDGTMAMTLEKPYQDHFVLCWQRIATRFKGHPAIWAFDLINEPTQNRPSPAGVADWLGVQVQAARAVRAIDPDTAISITVDGWGGPDGFTWMTPVDVPRVIYQVHMYMPHVYTHQGVNSAMPDPLLAYPGAIGGRLVDRVALRAMLAPVREFQRAYNVHIYVGEFSAIRWAPGADRYLADCIDLFEEYGWDWSYHAFREWPGWSLEHADLPADKDRHVPATVETARAAVLKAWFAKNR